MRADDVINERGAVRREGDHAGSHLRLGPQQDFQSGFALGFRAACKQPFIILRGVPGRGARDRFFPRVVCKADHRQAGFAGVGAVFGNGSIPRGAG